MDETSTNTNPDFLSGGGEMGKLIRYKDWSKTPLGSPTTWPQSLRTSVSLCIASNFPIAIAWGPQHVQIYNDGYWPITGDMHPTSMGQDFKECWISAWPVIGQAFEEASKGATRFLETQRIFLDRYGYSEETFFTFSFSPILDESGGVGGLFHPVIEQTQQTLAERRLNILPAVANHTVNARTAKEASALIMDCLKDFELDIPFVLLYSIDADGKEANLDGSVGVERDSPLAPAKINLEEHSLKSWPLIEAIQNGKSVQVEKLAEIFGSFDCGPYPEPPEQALVFPVILPGAAHNNYFLVTGVSSRRRLDEKYLLFYELLTASVTNVLTKARAYEEERKKAEALAEIDKAKMVFFSNISHEFRTPLTLMLSPLEELLNQKNNNFSEGEKENIETTHRNALRLLKLVNTLLDFSRIESGRQQGVFSLMDIAALTKNLASNFRSVIEKAGLKLIVKAESIIRPVYVDKHMWEKIVFNLLSNAFKYTLEGSIIVKLTSEKDFIVLKIKDTGVGIPENELPKMFERFHRVQNVTGRTYEGTGIGLSLIKELVKMHHGTIGVESKLNEGSVFTVKIPFGKEHLNEHQISETVNDTDEIYANIYIDEAETLLNTEKLTNESSTAKHSNLHLSTILVVDDNADMREHISSILSNNFNVITANNGMDALHKLKETIPALVLSDIMMPVMDGIGLLKEIKSNKSTANIPVILLTARAGEQSRIEGWETGADDYLVKPFSSKELISRIASQIKTQQIRAASETMLKNIFMQAPVAISVLEVSEYKYVLVNPEAQKLFRRTAEQVLGKTVKELFPEAESQGLVQIFDQVLSTGVTFAVNEMPLMLEDLNVGVLRLRYLNFSVEAIKNGDGKVQSLLIVCLDTTEQVETRKKVEESESRFRLMANAIPEVIWVADVQGQPEFFNKRWEEFSGVPFEVHTAAEVVAAFLHPDDAPAVLAAFSEAIKTGRLMEVEQRNRSASGEYRWFLNRAAPYRNPQTGEIEKWFGIGTDIDERKKTEQALAESESRFRSMADASPLLIWTIDANGLSAYYNKTFLDFIGVSKDEDIADWRKIIHPEDVQSTFDTVNTAIAERRSYSLECRLLRADGHWRWVLAQGNPRMGTNNEFLGFVGSSVDITERQQAEEKLKESEKQFSTLANNIQNLAWIADGEGWIFWYNQRWYDYTGTTFDEMKGWGWKKVHHPDHVERVADFTKQAWQKNEPFEITFPLRSKDGKYRWFLTRVFPVTDAKGKILRWIGTNTDIEEQKAFSEQLKEQVNERTVQLNTANQNLEEKNTELQKMNKELEAFTYISSHDLQEPLRKIQTFAGRIIDTEKEHLSDTAKDYFRRMQNAATRMQTLIQDLLEFSRLSTSERKFAKTDLSKIVDEVKEEFKEVMEEKNAAIIAGEMCEANIIPFQFRQLMHNLIGNALKFSKKDAPPNIIIKGELLGGSNSPFASRGACHISVSDNGIGFEKQFSERIFGVFQRLHGKDEYTGTGIGLAIVKKIVDNHNGIITAESELGKGATFNIYLPV